MSIAAQPIQPEGDSPPEAGRLQGFWPLLVAAPLGVAVGWAIPAAWFAVGAALQTGGTLGLIILLGVLTGLVLSWGAAVMGFAALIGGAERRPLQRTPWGSSPSDGRRDRQGEDRRLLARRRGAGLDTGKAIRRKPSPRDRAQGWFGGLMIATSALTILTLL